jgi:hypothetical protein
MITVQEIEHDLNVSRGTVAVVVIVITTTIHELVFHVGSQGH